MDNEEGYQIRLQDFIYAQEKRRDLYGDVSPWGILGLYEHMAAIRTDIEWAENVAWRRKHGKKCVFMILVCLFVDFVSLVHYSYCLWQFDYLHIPKLILSYPSSCIKFQLKDTFPGQILMMKKREALTDHSSPTSFSSSVQ